MNKKIDLSLDPLYYEVVPCNQLLQLRQNQLKKVRKSKEPISNTHRRREPSFFHQEPHPPNYSELVSYVKLQQREIDGLKRVQKFINKGKIMGKYDFHVIPDIPNIDDYFFDKTRYNLTQKLQYQQSILLERKRSIDKTFELFDKQPKTQKNIMTGSTIRNYSLSKAPSQMKAETPRIVSHFQVNKQLRQKKQTKIQEIISKSEERREKSMEIKNQVYCEKPNTLQFTKLEIRLLRKRWIQNFKQLVDLNQNQEECFKNIMQMLKNSELKISSQIKSDLNVLRLKLLQGSYIEEKDIIRLLNNPETKELGEILWQNLTFKNKD